MPSPMPATLPVAMSETTPAQQPEVEAQRDDENAISQTIGWRRFSPRLSRGLLQTP